MHSVVRSTSRTASAPKLPPKFYCFQVRSSARILNAGSFVQESVMASAVPELSVLARDQAFETLYRQYVKDVYHYALALLRNPADAEDVTQTTFLNAYRAYLGGIEIENPHNWLIKICHNVARTRYARAGRRVKEVPLEDHVEQLAVPDADRLHRTDTTQHNSRSRCRHRSAPEPSQLQCVRSIPSDTLPSNRLPHNVCKRRTGKPNGTDLRTRRIGPSGR